MANMYQAYYTKNLYITKYMVDMIAPSAQDLILEPCGGYGDFIDTLLDYNKALSIETCDLNIEAVQVLKKKYCMYSKINVRHTDTLTDVLFDQYAKTGYYDKIIGNPPYGAWQEYAQRELLKKKYKGFYVKETYSLFLLRCASLLKPKGLLSFIIPDTFLFLHNHKELRSYLLTNTKIKEILIFPSKFFPGVSFGYSNLCIITIQKTFSKKEALDNTFNVIKGFSSDKELDLIRHDKNNLTRITLKQNNVFDTAYHAFMLDNEGVDQLIRFSTTFLGDYADCVTGIYCGDNKKFIYSHDNMVKGSKDYPTVDIDLVDYNCSSLFGTSDNKRYVPLVKGSSKSKYVRERIDWFIDWSKDAIHYYNTEKKARFQNASFYFKKGIALPMVKSSKISATVMDNMVFDQSIVGIFPKDDRFFLYFLGLLNSQIFNKIIHVINPTANNSANYLRKAPVPLPSNDDLHTINHLVECMIDNPKDSQTEDKLNLLLCGLYDKLLLDLAI